MAQRLRFHDFGDGFRVYAFVDHSVLNLGTWADAYKNVDFGAIVSKSHFISRLPLFVLNSFYYLVNEDEEELYTSNFMSELMNPPKGSEERSEFESVLVNPVVNYKAKHKTDYYQENFGFDPEKDFLWRGTHWTSGDIDKALDRRWDLVKADGKAISSLTLDEILAKVKVSCGQLPDDGLWQFHPMDWVGFFREKMREKDLEIAMLQERVVRLRDRKNRD